MTEPVRIALKPVQVRRLERAFAEVARVEALHAGPLQEYAAARGKASAVLRLILTGSEESGLERIWWDLEEDGDDVYLVERVPEEEPDAEADDE